MPAYRLLTLFTLVAAALCLTVTQTGGEVAAYAAIAIGLFNSIMFPVIFTLTLERSTASQAATSGLLCMAITGGALLRCWRVRSRMLRAEACRFSCRRAATSGYSCSPWLLGRARVNATAGAFTGLTDSGSSYTMIDSIRIGTFSSFSGPCGISSRNESESPAGAGSSRCRADSEWCRSGCR